MERAVTFQSVQRCSLGQRVITAVWFALVLVVFPNIADAFSETFTRSKGKPVTEIRKFSVQDPAADATLSIQVSQVSSAVITLNDVQIFGPSHFNQTVTFLESAVTLLADNELAVELRGKPGGTLTIEIATSGPPLSVAITSPAPGTTVNSDSILVTGTFEGPTNTGITVNGAAAAISNNQFFATVPLTEGNNTLTATATTLDGATVRDAVAVIGTSTESESIQVFADPQSGIAPLTVQFNVANSADDPLQRFEVDFDGDGSVDVTTTDPNVLVATHTYTTPGVFQAQSTVTDGAGIVHSAAHVIVVNSFDTAGQMLRGVYTTMLDRLRVGDIQGALNTVTGSARAKYEAVFTAIGPGLASAVDQLGTIERTSISEDFAEFMIVRETNGERRAYFLYFLRGEDGVWRIESM